MKQISGELLAQGFAKLIVQSWLKLDQINNKYRLTVDKQNEGKILVPKPYLEMDQQALYNENNFYYQEFDIDNSTQQTKRCVFQYYLQEQKDKLGHENPELNHVEIRIKAANNFKNLPPSKKIHYLKQYLQENKYRMAMKDVNKNGQTPQQPFQNYLHSSFNPFNPAENMVVIPSLFDNTDNYWRRQKQSKELNYFDQVLKDKIQEENASSIKKPANNYQSSDSRQKNDANKVLNQTNDKKNEEWKQKAQFQTLKSLFKRLQSNN